MLTSVQVRAIQNAVGHTHMIIDFKNKEFSIYEVDVHVGFNSNEYIAFLTDVIVTLRTKCNITVCSDLLILKQSANQLEFFTCIST